MPQGIPVPTVSFPAQLSLSSKHSLLLKRPSFQHLGRQCADVLGTAQAPVPARPLADWGPRRATSLISLQRPELERAGVAQVIMNAWTGPGMWEALRKE